MFHKLYSNITNEHYLLLSLPTVAQVSIILFILWKIPTVGTHAICISNDYKNLSPVIETSLWLCTHSSIDPLFNINANDLRCYAYQMNHHKLFQLGLPFSRFEFLWYWSSPSDYALLGRLVHSSCVYIIGWINWYRYPIRIAFVLIIIIPTLQPRRKIPPHSTVLLHTNQLDW